jgi:hypothetical protein
MGDNSGLLSRQAVHHDHDPGKMDAMELEQRKATSPQYQENVLEDHSKRMNQNPINPSDNMGYYVETRRKLYMYRMHTCCGDNRYRSLGDMDRVNIFTREARTIWRNR